MTRAAVVVVLIGGMFAAALAAPRRDATSRELAALETKLHGEWSGQGPCEGGLTFRADGTYERNHHGPAGTTSAGTWKVRWDALPPTLILTCKTSDNEADEGQVTELRIVRLDDEGLAYTHAGGPASQKPTRFVRANR